MKANCPLLPDSTVRITEPDGLDTVTRAPCSTFRFVSSTVPDRLPVAVCGESFAPDGVVICAGGSVSGRAPSWAFDLKLSCARAVEFAKLEKINKMEPAARKGFDHRAKLNNVRRNGA